MKHFILYFEHQNNLGARVAALPWVKALDSSADESTLIDLATYADADYTALATDIAPTDRVILCGGDGSINHFVNDPRLTSLPGELYYFPCGTGNDFFRDLNRPADAPIPLAPYIQNLPTVEINGVTRRFLNNVGFGIDGYCCLVGDAQREARAGDPNAKPVNYTAIAIKGLLFHYKPCGATVTVDGETYRYKKAWLAPTMKGNHYGGGMIPAPAQDRSAADGHLSVMLMYGTGKLHTLAVFPGIFKGAHVKHKKMVAIHEGHDITVTFDRPSTVQIDGETVHNVTTYHAKA